MLDFRSIKNDFPVFTHNPGLVYLDSGATALKPKQVIEKIVEYYEKYPANIHRGIYKLSEKATKEYESAREIIARFIGAPSAENIVFTRSTTESINLVAYALGRQIMGEGDEIVTSIMEHHSNFVPWQALASENDALLKVINCDHEGNLDLGNNHRELSRIITRKTKIVAFTMVSNVLGTINPIKEIISSIRKINKSVIIMIDGAQAVQSMPVDVSDLDCDLFAFSGHKMLGPTGIGILYGKKAVLEMMSPFQYGGDMISHVSLQGSEFQPAPVKFEAGTPHIAGVIGLGAAAKYIMSIGQREILEHEQKLADYTYKRLLEEFAEKVDIFGPRVGKSRVGLIAFALKGVHPHDVAQILDENNIAVRAGHHCAMPLHTYLKQVASVRASFYAYNTESDIDVLIHGLKKSAEVFSTDV